MHPRQQNIVFCFSLACSLLINTGMVGVMVLQNDARAPLNLRSWQKKDAAKTTPGVLSAPLAEVFPAPQAAPTESPEPEKQAEPQPPAPPPESKPQKSLDFDNRDVFGETGGTGQALDSSPGAQPMLAHLGSQEQSYLGRNSPTAVGGGGGAAGEGGTGGVPLIGAVSPQSNATPQVRTSRSHVWPATAAFPSLIHISGGMGGGGGGAGAVTSMPSPAATTPTEVSALTAML